MTTQIESNLTFETKKQLTSFINFFLEYNKEVNLSSLKTFEKLWVSQVIDSLFALEFYELKNKTVLDIGSGGGFPGIVLAITCPKTHFTLLDSNNKKTTFLQKVVDYLGLKNVSIINERIETATLKKESFDFISAKAVAPLNILVELSAKYLKVGGQTIFYKGPNYINELPPDEEYLKQKLGLILEQIYAYEGKEKVCFTLICFSKAQKTKIIYPRLFQQIKKTPLY
ncbi:MAG: 16S rRNA (guanine(527)-N(7))-methyltransferase RsmG [Mycoplasmataceae bacterium]|nr:16S rRNA (guanine(527)-N(7))-methyltransferase RsmG [Mycoplasmataceae bacterium]